MKKSIIAESVAAMLAAFAISSAYADPSEPPWKVTGGGVFQDIGADGISGSQALYSFSVNIDPEKPAGKKSAQAIVRIDGPGLDAPLVLKADFDGEPKLIPFGGTPTPGQAFRFLSGSVAIWVFTHDNTAPDLDTEQPDWCGVWIEPVNGDGLPNFFGVGDDSFTAMGIVVAGNVVDHRK